MKAYVLHGIGDIRLDDVDIPEIKKDEVLVKVKAVGICGSDIPRIYKTGAYHFPLIPGHEFSGEVIKANSPEGEKWVGKRAGIFPLIPCEKCISCQKKQYEMCKSYSYLGSRRDGGFAEYVAVPIDNLIELADNVSFEEAAMMEPMAVAVHSIRRINPQKKDCVAVCGLGTIGMFILMFLTQMGIKNIYAIGNKDFQRKSVIRLGISEENYCDANNCDVNAWISEKTDGAGADIFFECVGKNETVNQAITNSAPGGKVMLVGNPYSDISMEKSIYWKILRNQITVTGTWNSSFTHNDNDDWHYVLNCLAENRINPSELISHRLGVTELEKGLLIMRDKSEDYVKVMMCLK